MSPLETYLALYDLKNPNNFELFGIFTDFFRLFWFAAVDDDASTNQGPPFSRCCFLIRLAFQFEFCPAGKGIFDLIFGDPDLSFEVKSVFEALVTLILRFFLLDCRFLVVNSL